MKTLVLLAFIITCTRPAFGDLRDVGRFSGGVVLGALGVVGAFVVHEGCHFGTVAAFGGKTRVGSWDGMGPTLWTRGMSDRGHRATAIAGNVCTGILAELIIANGWHRKSRLAWGAVAFHSFNAVAYGASDVGDARHWRGSGGSEATWSGVHYGHAARTTYVLGRDWDTNFMLGRKR